MMNILSTNTPVVGVSSGRFDDPAPHEALMDGDIFDVAPMNKVIVQETPTGETIVYKDSMGETLVRAVPTGVSVVTHAVPLDAHAGPFLAALLNQETSEELHTRWNEIQGRFVDEPLSAVQQADSLVSEVVEKVIQMFASEHSSLKSQWKQGNDVTTEDLRKALQHYRSFFNRLVV